MIVEKLDFIDYEPLIFRLIPVRRSDLPVGEVDQYVQDWLDKRESKPVCQFGCRRKYVDVRKVKKGIVEVAIEWICFDCMDVLFPLLGPRFPNIERIRVGVPDDEPFVKVVPPPSVRFQGRQVTFEDGRVEQVADFEIVNRPVSVEEMEAFCNATGYVTSAERQGRHDIYKKTACLEVQPPADRPEYPAEFLSHRDAAEFCKWAGYRLPTEGEFFVAALIDDEEHDAWPAQRVVLRAWARGKIWYVSGTVVTDTHVGELVVARHGPAGVKQRGWESADRWLVSEDQPIGMIVRVIR